MNRPLTDGEQAALMPLLQRRDLYRARLEDVEVGINAVCGAILGEPTPGTTLTTVDGRLILVTPEGA